MEKIKEIFSNLNKAGIPIPLFRDPKTGAASITATMFIITHMIAIVLLGGKAANLFGAVDYGNVLWLFGLTGSFYLGRKISGDGKNLTVGETVDKKED